jgi:S-ribosylhomocysteine lyase LuxS involved in autoinducer biosynthesis
MLYIAGSIVVLTYLRNELIPVPLAIVVVSPFGMSSGFALILFVKSSEAIWIIGTNHLVARSDVSKRGYKAVWLKYK